MINESYHDGDWNHGAICDFEEAMAAEKPMVAAMEESQQIATMP